MGGQMLQPPPMQPNRRSLGNSFQPHSETVLNSSVLYLIVTAGRRTGVAPWPVAQDDKQELSNATSTRCATLRSDLEGELERWPPSRSVVASSYLWDNTSKRCG